MRRPDPIIHDFWWIQSSYQFPTTTATPKYVSSVYVCMCVCVSVCVCVCVCVCAYLGV